MVDGMVGNQPVLMECHLTGRLWMITGADMRAESLVTQMVDGMVGLLPVLMDCHLTSSLGMIT